MTDLTIEQLVEEYLSLDKNPQTKQDIQRLQDQGNKDELAKRLRSRLEFGTAGLRAEMAGGYARINDLTVIQTTQGLCEYLLKVNENVKTQGVVIGHDHRGNSFGNSRDFARVAAAVFLERGIKVFLFRRLAFTPMVPFAVTKLGAAAGIMITASHNPKNDNGYKLYWSNGSQIIPPHDKHISQHIEQNLTPRVWDYNLCDSHELCSDPSEDVLNDYYQQLANYAGHREDNSTAKLKICYTAMHGVGCEFAERAFEVMGLQPFIPTKEQVLPDPTFPTVEFPNPEEGKGALALAMKTSNENGCEVILANDPDADRLAVAEKKKGNGEWVVFTGNQIGVMLAHYLWTEWKRKNFDNKDAPKVAMLASTVSSKMLKKIAQVEGFLFEDTLTGFKWLGNRSIELEKDGYIVLFAYEEAIGFMCGDLVKDKDGVSAAAVFAELAIQQAKRGKTCLEYLNELYETYGHFVSNNSYFICHDGAVIRKVFDRIRYGDEPKKPQGGEEGKSQYDYELAYPKKMGGFDIISIRDLTIGYDSTSPPPKYEPKLPVSNSTQMVTFSFENGEVTIRTSGTEPKIKYYAEWSGKTVGQATKELTEVVEDLKENVMAWKRFGLIARKSE